MRVSGQQRGRAKQLRQTMTRAETLLWRYIKAHRIEGLGFRRQVPLGIYVADFVCHATKLVVELDGESHDFESRLRRDATRDAWFASQGYRVLRFTNDQVLRNLEGVVSVIRETAGAAMPGIPPSLSLPHKGGGNPLTDAVPDGTPGADACRPDLGAAETDK
ncbi:endonuclease domain-containing protein [Rhodoplanes azumiensis]|uniref:Endonuclease domain-containing protein n=1 Tax=Rhodoplanes azumiensis TaxID=1897628 RepID=A0ABW5ARE3_9BRAD